MCLKHSPYRQTKRRREVCPLPSLSLFLFLLLLILDVFSCDPCSLLLRQSHRPFLLLFFHLLFFLCLSWFALRSVSSYHYILSFPQWLPCRHNVQSRVRISEGAPDKTRTNHVFLYHLLFSIKLFLLLFLLSFFSWFSCVPVISFFSSSVLVILCSSNSLLRLLSSSLGIQSMMSVSPSIPFWSPWQHHAIFSTESTSHLHIIIIIIFVIARTDLCKIFAKQSRLCWHWDCVTFSYVRMRFQLWKVMLQESGHEIEQ